MKNNSINFRKKQLFTNVDKICIRYTDALLLPNRNQSEKEMQKLNL